VAERWTTHDLPGIRWDPADEPSDDYDDEPDIPRDLRRQRIGRRKTRMTTITPNQEYL
jgi:hypothetical protein